MLPSKISREQKDFLILYALMQQRLDYEKKRNTGIPMWRRLFDSSSRNPLRGLDIDGTYQLQNLLSDSFAAAYPRLAAFSELNSAGPEGVVAKTEFSYDESRRCPRLSVYLTDYETNLSHREEFEFREGYGLIHEYQHDPDEKKSQANRLYVASSALSAREHICTSPGVTGYFRELDNMRFSDVACYLSRSGEELLKGVSRSEVKESVSRVKAFSVKRSATLRNRAIIEERVEKESKVSSLEGYVRNLARLKEISNTISDPGRTGRISNADRYCLCAEYAGLKQANCRVSAHRLLELACEGYNRDSLERIQSLAFPVVEGIHASEVSRESLRACYKFCELAVCSGYTDEQIRDYLVRNLEPFAEEMSEYRIASIRNNVAQEYYNKVSDYVSSLQDMRSWHGEFPKNLYDSIPMPKDKVIERMNQIDSLIFTHNYIEKKGETEPERIVSAMYEDFSNGKLIPSMKDLASVLNQNLAELQRMFDLEYGRNCHEIVNRFLYNPLLVESDVRTPVKILTNDILGEIVFLSDKELLVKLGSFLREIGDVRLGKESLEKQVSAIAEKMYGHGTKDDIARVENFRKKNSFLIESGKKWRHQFPKRVETKEKVKTSIKIG